MKQQIISGLKKELLLIEMPEYLKELTLGGESILDFDNGIKSNKCYGKLTDIKEEQFAELVETTNSSNGTLFEMYNYDQASHLTYATDCAKESFFSKLAKDEIYFHNPIKKPGATDHSGMKDLNEKLDRYYEAEEKVWDLNRCWIFEII